MPQKSDLNLSFGILSGKWSKKVRVGEQRLEWKETDEGHIKGLPLCFNSGVIQTRELLYSFKKIASYFLTATVLQFLRVLLIGIILEDL